MSVPIIEARTEKSRRAPLLRLLILSSLLLTAIALFYVAWNIGRPYPLHCRENAAIFGTAILLRNQNPYDLAHHPTFLYTYGIVESLVVYPVALLFGPTLLVHRAVSLAGLFLTCGVLFWGMRVSRVSPLLALSGSMLLFAHLVATGDFSADPNSLGMLFFLLSVVVPHAGNFRRGSLAAGIIFAFLGLYTKPYFVIGGLLLIPYLFLFRSKMTGILTGLFFLGILVTSVLVVNSLLPLYFTDIYFTTRNITDQAPSISHLFRILMSYLPLGAGLIGLLACRLMRRGKNEASERMWPPETSLFDLSKPFFLRPSMNWITFILLGCTAVYVLKMGLNDGAGLQYIIHLIVPFLIWRAYVVGSSEFSGQFQPVMFLEATIITVGAYLLLIIVKEPGGQTACWQHATQVMTRYHDVLQARALSGIAWDQGKPVYDTGHSEYYPWSFAGNPSSLMPLYKQKCDAREKSIKEKVRNRQFDAVIIFKGDMPLMSEAVLAQYYHRIEVFPLKMAFNGYKLEVWEPNQPSVSAGTKEPTK